MKKLTLEYIAGFVDGEGSFSISKRSRDSYQARFSVSNSNKHILEEIRKFFSITTTITPYKPKIPNSKISYQLKATAIDQCKSIARQLEPYLRLKKEQAQIFMQYPRAHSTNKASDILSYLSTKAYVLKLRKTIMKLNKTGPVIKELI